MFFDISKASGIMEFNADSFSDMAGTQTGRDLWDFLNDNGILIRPETTPLQRPALEGAQPR
jgi:hypothetical protein